MRMLVALSNVVSTSKRSIICYAFFLQKKERKIENVGKLEVKSEMVDLNLSIEMIGFPGSSGW